MFISPTPSRDDVNETGIDPTFDAEIENPPSGLDLTLESKSEPSTAAKAGLS